MAIHTNEIEVVWYREYRDFMVSFYPEESTLVSTWEVYRMAKVKSRKEIKNLLDLTETLNQIRDNLQDKNRKLEQELQKTREQLEKAEKVISELIEAMPHYGDCSLVDDKDADCDCWKESDVKFARQYFKDKDKQGE